jgi:hypothetical protein
LKFEQRQEAFETRQRQRDSLAATTAIAIAISLPAKLCVTCLITPPTASAQLMTEGARERRAGRGTRPAR